MTAHTIVSLCPLAWLLTGIPRRRLRLTATLRLDLRVSGRRSGKKRR
ncbi:MAG TPA: hypothetical protein VMB79_06395 [Jatrophihabitans sp.]|nr:hypothetical protein [Jatrophihabitans sp.]